MRISDWSSDVCSSDLSADTPAASAGAPSGDTATAVDCDAKPVQDLIGKKYSESVARDAQSRSNPTQVRVLQVGRASGRERVCHSVTISVAGVTLKTKRHRTLVIATLNDNTTAT